MIRCLLALTCLFTIGVASAAEPLVYVIPDDVVKAGTRDLSRLDAMELDLLINVAATCGARAGEEVQNFECSRAIRQFRFRAPLAKGLHDMLHMFERNSVSVETLAKSGKILPKEGLDFYSQMAELWSELGTTAGTRLKAVQLGH